MKTTLSMPRTISMAESVASARRPSAVRSAPIRSSGRALLRPAAARAARRARSRRGPPCRASGAARAARPPLPTPSGSPPRRRGSPPGSSRCARPSSSAGIWGKVARAAAMRWATSDRSRPMASGIIRERSIVSGSRRTAAQCLARTSRLWRKVSRSTRVQFHSSANSAAMRRVRFSPRPPITSRSRPWVGRGWFSALWSG